MKDKNKLGIDASISYTILTKILQGFGSMVILLMITRNLSIGEQGYYYTFASILSIQIFFELGITSIVTQYVAHEFAHLSWQGEQICGDGYHLSRLTSIVRLSIKWMGGLSLFMFAALFVAGYAFFSYHNDRDVNWVFAWVTLAFAGSVLLLVNLVFAIFEGIGKIREIAKMRFVQQAVYSFTLIILLAAGQKLVSAGLAMLASLVTVAFSMCFAGFGTIARLIWNTEVTAKINYKKEVLPFQYRMALGNISGYFIYQLINPVLFALAGPVIAGQMGATQAVLNGILSISLSFMTIKVARLSHLAALNEFEQLNALYNSSFKKSLLLCLTGLLGFIIGLYVFEQYFPLFRYRFLPIVPVVFFALTQLASAAGNCQAYYLRSFKSEPFFIVSIVIGVASGIATVVCAKYYNITVLSAVYFVVNGVVGFIWGYVIFYRKRLEWTSLKR